MAVTFNLDGGGNVTITAPSGTDSTLTISTQGINYTFTLIGESWSNIGSGTWSGSGTTQIRGAFSQVSGTITVDLADGTNALNIIAANNAIVFAPSAGTNTVVVGAGNLLNVTSGTLLGVTGAVTVTVGSSTTSLVISDYLGSPNTFTIGAASIAGLDAGFNYTGTLASLYIVTCKTGPNIITVASPPILSLQVDCNGITADTVTINSISGLTTAFIIDATLINDTASVSLTSNGHALPATTIGCHTFTFIDSCTLGSFTFNGVAGGTFIFTDGIAITVSNSVTLQRCILQGSATAGWTIAMPVTQTISDVVVSYSTATGHAGVANSSVNGGHNTNWMFPGALGGAGLFGNQFFGG
jgi:hypothetical protein